jgi:heme/copper-type cytochrome/quinol oxidase subunit 2
MLNNKPSVKNKNRVVTRVFFFLFPIFYSLNTFSQCAMCRAALESTGNKAKVEAVNDGIVFLMAIPYILVAGVGFVVYKMYYKKEKTKDSKAN